MAFWNGPGVFWDKKRKAYQPGDEIPEKSLEAKLLKRLRDKGRIVDVIRTVRQETDTVHALQAKIVTIEGEMEALVAEHRKEVTDLTAEHRKEVADLQAELKKLAEDRPKPDGKK